MKQCIGIIGGMGPMATCDLMNKMIKRMKADSDQEYIRICVDCNTVIPDRTASILKGGASPVPEMVKSAIRLQNSGANVLTIACNTAHYYYDEISAQVDVPIIHMPMETAAFLKGQGVQIAAVLATDGTVQSGIYEEALTREGIQTVYPNTEEQALLMTLIYDCVKAGRSFDMYSERILTMADRLQKQGAQAFILGCTELPIVFDVLHLDIPCVDPTDVLACAAIRFCGGELR